MSTPAGGGADSQGQQEARTKYPMAGTQKRCGAIVGQRLSQAQQAAVKEARV